MNFCMEGRIVKISKWISQIFGIVAHDFTKFTLFDACLTHFLFKLKLQIKSSSFWVESILSAIRYFSFQGDSIY